MYSLGEIKRINAAEARRIAKRNKERVNAADAGLLRFAYKRIADRAKEGFTDTGEGLWEGYAGRVNTVERIRVYADLKKNGYRVSGNVVYWAALAKAEPARSA